MSLEQLNQILAKHKRVAIVGGPKTGKTTLSRKLQGVEILHTDDLMHLNWEHQPEAISERLRGKSTFVVEGVQTARALRKGLEVDAVIFLDEPHQELIRGQLTMLKGVQKVFKEWQEKHPDVPVFSIKVPKP